MQLWLVMIKTDQLIAKYVKCWIKTLFYIKNTFISNVKLKLVENQANAKQHILHPSHHPKIIGHSKK